MAAPSGLAQLVAAIAQHTEALPPESIRPFEHYRRGANDAWNLWVYFARNIQRTNVYYTAYERHATRLRSMVLLSLVEAFERYLKETAAICVDHVGRLVLDDRLNVFRPKATSLAAVIAPTAHREYRRAWKDDSIELDDVLDMWNDIAAEYLRRVGSLEKSRGINRYAAPAVGAAFSIKSLGHGADQGNGVTRVHDIASNTDRDLGWPYHFGGVIAQSGTDRVTLENYARGDNRQAGRDPRWYFQMYGTGAGQSFHEFHVAKQQYANPITVVVTHNS